MKKGFSTIILLLLAVAVLAGCCAPVPAGPSGTPWPTSSPAPVGPVIEPTALISKAEAEVLLNTMLKDDTDNKPEPTTSPAATPAPLAKGMKMCYYGAAGKNAPFMQVTVYEKGLVGAGAQEPRHVYDTLKHSVTPVAVPGLGEDAFIAAPGIHIAYQGYYIMIAVGDPTVPANVEILKNAGAKAVENLMKVLGTK